MVGLQGVMGHHYSQLSFVSIVHFDLVIPFGLKRCWVRSSCSRAVHVTSVTYLILDFEPRRAFARSTNEHLGGFLL